MQNIFSKMGLIWLPMVFVFTISHSVFCASAKIPPHIIYILADDLGWNDLSFHGSDQIPTPNIDALAYNGVILNRYYTQPMCTPSRACLMTGRYAIHTGQHTAARSNDKSGLPLSLKIMPEYLRELGYSTHIVGKWHLGYFHKNYTPLQRGFDSHFGYWTGFTGYYDHSHLEEISSGLNVSNYAGLDFRRDYSPVWDLEGQYATELFTKEAVSLIEHHSNDKPMFLYLSHLAVHSGNNDKLLEAPLEEIKKFSYIRNPARRTYAAMVSRLDQSVGEVVSALGKKDMLKNSIIVFSSDNGPPNFGYYRNWGSCYPFRGQKDTVWEGGVRAPAVVWSPLISKSSRVSHQLMHISDWLPTLLSAAGSDTAELSREGDGMNQWHAIVNGYPGPRDSLLIDIYNKTKSNCFILGPFKYIKGSKGVTSSFKESDSYLNFDTIFSKDAPKYDEEKIRSSIAWTEIQKISKTQLASGEIKKLRHESTVTCDHGLQTFIDCDKEPCLFNIVEDPCEQKNIAKDFSVLVSHIEEILDDFKSGKYPEDPMTLDLQSDPEFFNGTWSIWVE